MKNKILTTVSFLFIFAMVATPALAASSSYAFEIMVSVNGKNKGVYHTLDKGTVYIDGFAFYNGTKEPWATLEGKGETVYYSLYKRFFFQKGW